MANTEGALAAAEEETKEEAAEASAAPEETKEQAAPASPEAEKPKAEEEPEPEETEEPLDTTMTLQSAKKIRNESRILRQKNKALAAETETLKARIAELEGTVVKSTTESLRVKYGLSEKQAKYITGETPEDMEASAAEIAEDLGIGNKVDFSSLSTPGIKSKTSGEIASLSDEEILKKLL